MNQPSSNDDIAVDIINVSKEFRLPHENVNSLKSAFIRMYRKRRGYEIQHALRDISFTVQRGEFFGIVGRNGSGKSTLLKTVAGIYQPTTGTVRRNGKLVPFIELGVGFNPELSGRENVYLNGALLGFNRRQIDAHYASIVEFSGLERFMDQKLKNYSSGMQVRLAFAVATRAEAEILLVDEVLAVGDAEFQRKCFEYFQELKASDTTVIFVTHDMSAVREYCDRAILIEDSVIVAEGSPDAIATRYTRMFLEPKPAPEAVEGAEEMDTASDRWGDGSIRFGEPEYSTLLTDADPMWRLSVPIHILTDVQSAHFGYRILNGAGEAITGTNTQIEGIRHPSLRAGDVLDWVVEIPNIFSDGRYTVNIAAHHAGGLAVGEQWDGALEFECRRDRQTPFLVAPTPTISAAVRDP